MSETLAAAIPVEALAELAALLPDQVFRDDARIRIDSIRVKHSNRIYRLRADGGLTDDFIRPLLDTISRACDDAIASVQHLPVRPADQFANRPADLAPWWR